jgi:O-antigen/teichoic acid export membrane protein
MQGEIQKKALEQVAPKTSNMFLKSAIIYLGGRGVSGVLNFCSIALYTRLLDPVSYGRYALVIAGVALCQVVLFGWLPLGVLRFLSKHSDREQAFLSTVATAFLSTVALTVLGTVIILWCWTDPAGRVLVTLGAVLLWAQAWFDLNLVVAQTRLLPVLYGLLSASKAILALAIGGALVLGGLGAYGPILGLAVAAFVSAFGFIWREWREIRPGLWDRQLGRDLLAYGLPLTATFALARVVSSSDRFLLGWFLGSAAAGTYSASYDLAEMTLTLLMMVVNLATYPLIVRSLETEGQEAASDRLQQSGVLLLAVAVPAATGLTVCAPNIAGVVLGAPFREAGAAVVPWIALTAFLAGLKGFYFDLAFQLGRYTLGQVWITLVAAAVNLALNLWWIPVLGLMGAVYASVVAYTVALCLSWRLGRRAFAVPSFPAEAVKILVAAAIMAFLLWPLRGYQGWLMLLLQVGAGCLIYAVALLASDFYGIRKHFYVWVLSAKEATTWS